MYSGVLFFFFESKQIIRRNVHVFFLLSSLSYHLSLLLLCWSFPAGSVSLPMREMWAWSLGREDPLEKGMATHSSILAWRIPWTEEPSRLQSMGSQRLDRTERLNTFIFLLCWPLISPFSIPVPACGLCSGTFLHMEYTPALTLAPQNLPTPQTDHLFIYLFHIDTYLVKIWYINGIMLMFSASIVYIVNTVLQWIVCTLVCHSKGSLNVL